MSDNSCTDKENNNRKLLEYARNGYFDSFRGILDSQLDCDVNCIDDLRKSPLHWVCTGGNLDFLKFLIAKNADVHAKDERGWTPLAIACFSKHSSQLRYLLREARANINCGDGKESMVYNNRENIYIHILMFRNLDSKICR